MKRRLSQKNLLVVIVDSVCGSGWNGKSQQHDQHLGGSRMKSIYNFRQKKIHENLDERKCFNQKKIFFRIFQMIRGYPSQESAISPPSRHYSSNSGEQKKTSTKDLKQKTTNIKGV